MPDYVVILYLISLMVVFLSFAKSLSQRNLISEPSIYLKSSISKSITNTADIEQLYHTLGLISAHNENQESNINKIIQRCRNALVPLSFCVLNNPSACIYVNSIPSQSSIPFHTRPGKVFGYVMEGNIKINEIIINEVTTPTDNHRIVTQEDAFALSIGEDCVCRGGICPRRHGCVFWVEKQLRDKNGYMIGQMKETVTTNHDDDKVYFAFQDTFNIQPREFLNNEKYPAVIIEILGKEDDFDFVNIVSNMQYYRADVNDKSGRHCVSSSDSDVIVYSSEVPLGPAPIQLEMSL